MAHGFDDSKNKIDLEERFTALENDVSDHEDRLSDIEWETLYTWANPVGVSVGVQELTVDFGDCNIFLIAFALSSNTAANLLKTAATGLIYYNGLNSGCTVSYQYIGQTYIEFENYIRKVTINKSGNILTISQCDYVHMFKSAYAYNNADLDIHTSIDNLTKIETSVDNTMLIPVKLLGAKI